MIGLDTNVVIRHLVQDDPDQSPVASALVEELTETDPGCISLVALVEVYWVLRRAYKVPAVRCVELLEGLLDARELRIDQDAVVRTALTATHCGPDFADAVITETRSGSPLRPHRDLRPAGITRRRHATS